MSFEELGHILRQERERRGLSVEEVAGRLKLMPRVVRAIEQADIEVLPQAAYARGFVKAYGALLELEPGLVHVGIEDGWPGDLHQSSVLYEPIAERENSGKGRFAVFFSLVLILLAATGGFWFFRDLDLRLPSGASPKTKMAVPAKSEIPPPAAQVKGALPPESENRVAGRQTSPPSGVSPSPAAVVPAAPGQSGSPAVPADSRRTEAENVPVAVPQTTSLSAGSSAGPHQLIIIALAECWVHSNADDTNTREFSLRKGDTFALTFSKKLTLKLGNAGGVRIRLDGRDQEPPGDAGQVKTLTFPGNP